MNEYDLQIHDLRTEGINVDNLDLVQVNNSMDSNVVNISPSSQTTALVAIDVQPYDNLDSDNNQWEDYNSNDMR